jgi:hypothetical protein
MQLIVKNSALAQSARGASEPWSYPFHLADGITVATDLSAACATKWIALKGASRGSLAIGCTATGAPVGAVTLQVCGDSAATVGATYCIDGVTPTTFFAPNGAAASTFVDGIETNADNVRVVYTPASGGTGAVFTSDAGTAGSSPMLTLKE